MSNYASGFAANETGVRDAGSRGGNANKAHYPGQAGSQPGQQPGQPGQQQQPRSVGDQYISRQPQAYEAAAVPDYSRCVCVFLLCMSSPFEGRYILKYENWKVQWDIASFKAPSFNFHPVVGYLPDVTYD